MFYVYPHKVSLIKIPHYILIIKIWSLRFKLVNCLQIWVCWFFLYYIPNLPTLLVHQSCVDLQIEFCSMNQLQFETIHELVDLIMHHVPAVNFIYRQDNHILSHFFFAIFHCAVIYSFPQNSRPTNSFFKKKLDVKCSRSQVHIKTHTLFYV